MQRGRSTLAVLLVRERLPKLDHFLLKYQRLGLPLRIPPPFVLIFPYIFRVFQAVVSISSAIMACELTLLFGPPPLAVLRSIF